MLLWLTSVSARSILPSSPSDPSPSLWDPIPYAMGPTLSLWSPAGPHGDTWRGDTWQAS